MVICGATTKKIVLLGRSTGKRIGASTPSDPPCSAKTAPTKASHVSFLAYRIGSGVACENPKSPYDFKGNWRCDGDRGRTFSALPSVSDQGPLAKPLSRRSHRRHPPRQEFSNDLTSHIQARLPFIFQLSVARHRRITALPAAKTAIDQKVDACDIAGRIR